MKFLFSLSLVAFTGVFTCRASEVRKPCEALQEFLSDFNGFNDSCRDLRAGRRAAELSFKLCQPGHGAFDFQIAFEALENTFHWDKEKISVLGTEGLEAWELMAKQYLLPWFWCHAAIHDNPDIKPVVSTTPLEKELYEALCKLFDAHDFGEDVENLIREAEELWSKLLEGGRMYRLDLLKPRGMDEEGPVFAPDVLMTKFVRYMIECYRNPGLVLGSEYADPDIRVSDYSFDTDGERAASTTRLVGKHSAIHAPASLASLPPALARLFALPGSSTKREAWSAIIARSRTGRSSRHRSFIALAALAIFALAVAAFCLCSRKKKQDASFSDLDAIVNVV